MTAFYHWLSGDKHNLSKETRLAAAQYALFACQNNEACLVSIKQFTAMPTPSLHRNSYIVLVNKVINPTLLYIEPTVNMNIELTIDMTTLFYIDYDCHVTLVPIHEQSHNALMTYATLNQDNKKTYCDINQELKAYVSNKLPTEEQLEALKDGALGDIMTDICDIMTDAGHDIITGNKDCGLNQKALPIRI